MEVRVLMSARNAPLAFDLRCEVREKLITFIQRELRRTREEVRAQTMDALSANPGKPPG